MSAAADDRLLPETRWAALVVFIILVPAVIILWGTPGETADRWAWTIKPDLTPIFLGAGYGAGAYFFWRTFHATRWHPSSSGVLGASVFAALMLIATLIHWDRFNHGDAPFLAAFVFWGWTIVYIISPPVVFALWEDEADDAANLRWLPSVMTELEPLAIGHYLAETDLLAATSRAQRSFAQPNWDRLQELRRNVDPDGVFPSYLAPADRPTDTPPSRV